MKRTRLGALAGLLAAGFAAPLPAAPLAHFRTLHEFALTEGTGPIDELVLGQDGQMYGTTFYGGTYHLGTAYRLHRSGAVDTLFNFGASDTTMVQPRGLMAASDGHLYGVVQGGNDRGFGGVYRMTTQGQVTQLVDFGSRACRAPVARLAEASDGRLYGSTQSGGAHSGGCLYRVEPNGAYMTLRDLNDGDGVFPQAAMTPARDGSVYGVLPYAGPADGGTIFRLTPGGGFSVVHAFEAPFRPQSALVEGPDGSLYGTCYEGGANRLGAVYRFDPASGGVTLLHEFSGAADGARPGGLSLGSDGWLHGAAREGGERGGGVLYRLALDGTLEVLHAMRPAKKEGHAWPAPLEAADGVFYGVTNDGGVEHLGSAYRLRLR
ncbi:MAG: choice-of-anchor tandem repeat GloVer-containing protein [Burkholderiaceae bacterium]